MEQSCTPLPPGRSALSHHNVAPAPGAGSPTAATTPTRRAQPHPSSSSAPAAVPGTASNLAAIPAVTTMMVITVAMATALATAMGPHTPHGCPPSCPSELHLLPPSSEAYPEADYTVHAHSPYADTPAAEGISLARLTVEPSTATSHRQFKSCLPSSRGFSLGASGTPPRVPLSTWASPHHPLRFFPSAHVAQLRPLSRGLPSATAHQGRCSLH